MSTSPSHTSNTNTNEVPPTDSPNTPITSDVSRPLQPSSVDLPHKPSLSVSNVNIKNLISMIPISTNITSRVPLPSFIEARSMLLTFEVQLKSFGPVLASLDHSSPAAFFAPRHFQSNGNRGRYGRGRNNQQSRFSKCRGTQNYSPQWRPSPSLLGASPSLVCQYCSKLGHSERDFPQLVSKALYVEASPGSTMASPSTSTPFETQWHFDTGATSHMTPNSGMLSSLRPYTDNARVLVGDGSLVPITHLGDFSFSYSSTKSFTLNNVLVVPNLPTNLVSIKRFSIDNNCYFLFGASSFCIKDKNTHQTLVSCASPDPLYSVPTSKIESLSPSVVAFPAQELPSSTLCHMHLGHLGTTAFASLSRSSVIPVKHRLSSSHDYRPCQLGNHTRRPHPPNPRHASGLFELIHSDVWTSPIESISDFKYYVVFLDDYSRFAWVFPIKNKSESPQQTNLPQSSQQPTPPQSSPLSSLFQNPIPNSLGSSTIVHTRPDFSHQYPQLPPIPSPSTTRPPPTTTMITRSQNGISKPRILPSLLSSECVLDLVEPTSYSQASRDPLWRRAMADEYNALLTNDTWCLVPPPGVNLIGTKWVFKLKFHADGSLSRRKCRLVAQGQHQQHGIDYDETFSPVVKPATIRSVLTMESSQNCPFASLMLKTLFSMVICLRRFISSSLLGLSILIFPIMFVSLTRLFMV
ncbi:hypothetical protein LIER_29300 [Lithospermum erythrorhizon]|uniref:Mitochondrial protein n=1 Tax=Lithospermum erythrorhizon TaxID=34254 RepID=A0AAV3RNU0_LITER